MRHYHKTIQYISACMALLLCLPAAAQTEGLPKGQYNMAEAVEHIFTMERIDEGFGSRVFSNPGNWAQIVVECKAEYDVNFMSNLDEIVDRTKDPVPIAKLGQVRNADLAILAKVEQHGANKHYHLWFQTGKKYKDRTITVSASYNNNYGIMELYLTNLSAKASLRYRLFDTGDENDGTAFQEHYVKGAAYFKDNNYQFAKQEYTLALYCKDGDAVKKAHVKDRVIICDSLISLTQQADQFANQERYDEAASKYYRALMYNGSDRYLFMRYLYCSRKHKNASNIYMREADMKYLNKDYEGAKALYGEVVNLGGSYSDKAMSRYEDCERMARKQKNRERYFGLNYAFGATPSYGISYGVYRSRVDFQVTARVTNNAFRLIRNDYRISDCSKLDITMGPTIPLVRAKTPGKAFGGLWLDVGVGAAVANIFQIKNEHLSYFESTVIGRDITDEDVDRYISQTAGVERGSDVMKMRIGCAVDGEVALKLKLWRLGISASYLHRFPITKGFADRIQQNQFTLGLGFFF